VKFWDSSAIIPLLVREPSRARLLKLLAADGEMIAWWGSAIECASALARREREGHMDSDQASEALVRLAALERAWVEVNPSRPLRDLARRLVRTHDLRAADSLQLAAALTASEFEPRGFGFVVLDERLARAARREGFAVTG
jgi:predicted nucleic acid-binding protein